MTVRKKGQINKRMLKKKGGGRLSKKKGDRELLEGRGGIPGLYAKEESTQQLSLRERSEN